MCNVGSRLCTIISYVSVFQEWVYLLCILNVTMRRRIRNIIIIILQLERIMHNSSPAQTTTHTYPSLSFSLLSSLFLSPLFSLSLLSSSLLSFSNLFFILHSLVTALICSTMYTTVAIFSAYLVVSWLNLCAYQWTPNTFTHRDSHMPLLGA